MNTNTDRDTPAARAAAAGVWPPVLAVDPGSQSTGICLRVGTGALEAVTVERIEDRGDHVEAVEYADAVIETCREITRRNRDRLNAEAHRRSTDPGGLRHAVETLVAPTPAAMVKGRRAAVAPRVLASLPVASTVLGMVVGVWPRTILVPPLGEPGWDGVGREHAPSALSGRTPAGWMVGGADRSHQRSAWAIAGAAHALTCSSLREQAQRAAGAAAAQRPSAAPEALVPVLRRSIARTGSWDLMTRLPALARAVVAMTTGDQSSGDRAAAAVEAYLAETEPKDNEGGRA